MPGLKDYCPMCGALQQEWVSRMMGLFNEAQLRGYSGANLGQRALAPPKCPRHTALDVLLQLEAGATVQSGTERAINRDQK